MSAKRRQAVLNTSESHTHTLSVPVADIIAGTEQTYSTGNANPGPHCHQVTITAADFTTLQTGGTVRVYSCNFTEHEYVLSCVGTPVADGDAADVCGSSDVGGGC